MKVGSIITGNPITYPKLELPPLLNITHRL